MNNIARLFLLLVVFVTSGSNLFAHQQKQAVTRIIFNERLQSIEIIHRFSIHDAEHAAKLIFGKSADIIGDTNSQNLFSDYVIDNFSLSGVSGSDQSLIKLPLSSVGFEVDGRFIWIYQETSLVSGLTGLSVIDNALREIWSEQVNLVNVEFPASKDKTSKDKTSKDKTSKDSRKKTLVRSLVFRGSLEKKTLSLE